MAAERASFPVRLMARLLGVSASGFYSWASSHASPGPPDDPWGPLRAEAMRLWLASGRRWGARTIRSQLGGALAGTTLYRVRKCMRELGIRGVAPRRRVRTTVPDPSAPSRPDLLRRDFSSPVPTTRLVGDITYLRTGQGWLYLSTVIDLATRMVVGWCMLLTPITISPSTPMHHNHSRQYSFTNPTKQRRQFRRPARAPLPVRELDRHVYHHCAVPQGVGAAGARGLGVREVHGDAALRPHEHLHGRVLRQPLQDLGQLTRAQHRPPLSSRPR